MGSSQSTCVDTDGCGCECHKINWMKILEKGVYEIEDGSPVQIDLTLTFKELELVTSGDDAVDIKAKVQEAEAQVELDKLDESQYNFFQNDIA